MISKNLHDYIFASAWNLPEEINDEGSRELLLKHLNTHVKTTPFKHKILLHQAGMIPDRLHYVESGVVRGYISDKSGKKEKTVSMWFQNSLLADANCFIHELESDVSIEVLPNTILSSISRIHFNELIESFPCLSIILTCLIQNHEKYSNARLFNGFLTAWERLEKIRKIYPGLEQMVSKEMIASFLNITPQHLSRIIREHFKKKSH